MGLGSRASSVCDLVDCAVSRDADLSGHAESPVGIEMWLETAPKILVSVAGIYRFAYLASLLIITFAVLWIHLQITL